jgi:hypothetical protein
MRSFEVLRKASDPIGVKALAAILKLSPALVYKWCQEWDPNDPDASGARNPLDRVADIVRATGDIDVVNWICHQAGGFFVANPSPPQTDSGTTLVVNTQRLVKEFSELLMAVTNSIADDGQIEQHEAARIRDEWEFFKTTVEAFVIASEKGMFHSRKNIG